MLEDGEDLAVVSRSLGHLQPLDDSRLLCPRHARDAGSIGRADGPDPRQDKLIVGMTVVRRETERPPGPLERRFTFRFVVSPEGLEPSTR